jgi:hypothetical protein
MNARQSRTVFISIRIRTNWQLCLPLVYGPIKTFEARYETPSSVARSRPLQLSGLPVLTPPLPVMIIACKVWYAAVLIDEPHHDRVYVLVCQHSVWRRPFLTPIPVGVCPPCMCTLLILNVVVCVMVSCAPSDRRSGREEFSVTGTHDRVLIALLMRGTPICLWHSTTAYPGDKAWQMSKGHQHPRWL